MIELLNIDCMEYMATQPDKAFDLAIVDPPYGIGASEKNSTDKKQCSKSAAESKKYGEQRWDDEIPGDDYFNELIRVSKKQVVWGANFFGLKGGYLFWDKVVTMPTYSRGEVAWLSWKNSIDYHKYEWHGMIQGDMKNKEHRIHPTQKPVKLYEWLLTNYAKPGQRILDTHAGSMSSVIACHYFGCDIVACEIDKDYFNAGKIRVENETKQQDLFSSE